MEYTHAGLAHVTASALALQQWLQLLRWTLDRAPRSHEFPGLACVTPMHRSHALQRDRLGLTTQLCNAVAKRQRRSQ